MKNTIVIAIISLIVLSCSEDSTLFGTTYNISYKNTSEFTVEILSDDFENFSLAPEEEVVVVCDTKQPSIETKSYSKNFYIFYVEEEPQVYKIFQQEYNLDNIIQYKITRENPSLRGKARVMYTDSIGDTIVHKDVVLPATYSFDEFKSDTLMLEATNLLDIGSVSVEVSVKGVQRMYQRANLPDTIAKVETFMW